MDGMTLKQAKERWHDLVVKHALGTITTQEMVKLDRYQNLLRHKPTAAEKVFQSRMEYARKRAIRVIRKYQRAGNIGLLKQKLERIF